MADTAKAFDRDRYALLPSLLKEPTLSQFYRYACKLADAGWMRTGDGLLADTPSAYGDFMIEGLLNNLLPKIEQATRLKLFPTYSYFRVYKNGDAVARHSDRSACEISVSLCLGYEGQPWRFCVAGPRGVSYANLEPGDAVLYRGIECPHWRDAFEGTRQAQVFLHYVNQNGPYAEWKFDKRSSTTEVLAISGSSRA